MNENVAKHLKAIWAGVKFIIAICLWGSSLFTTYKLRAPDQAMGACLYDIRFYFHFFVACWFTKNCVVWPKISEK